MSGDRGAVQAPAPFWWRPRTVPDGHTLDCRLGPLTMQIFRAQGEWQLAVQPGEETDAPTTAALDLREGGIGAEIDPDHVQRFIFGSTSGVLRLVPLLADRSVVIRPRQSVFLPSGEETTMFLSSPLSLRIEVGEPAVVLREVPMLRLPDTWFGPSTREGELCYSGKTSARHTLADVPRRPHRAITPLRIRNEASSPLPLDRISLPVPVLSVYGAADGSLWTEMVTMIRGSDTDMAALRIEAGPPALSGDDTHLISAPRREQSRGSLVRAFNVLFGDGR
jgi:hypothetical protein